MANSLHFSRGAGEPADSLDRPGRRLVLSVALVAGAALAYQLLLMRLLSIIQWHHVVGMIISLALLGHGASGTALSLLGERARRWFQPLYVANAFGFSLGALACFALAQRVPFNALELVWNPRQVLGLAAIYLLLALPFFCAANCIGLSFIRWGGSIPWLYRADLTGAALGALGLILLLFLVPPALCLQLIGLCGLAAAMLAVTGWRVVLPAGALAVILFAPWMSAALVPHLSDYKGLSRQLQISGSRILEERSSPLGLLSVVESPQVPLRHAPGLSLVSRQEPPPQLGVFTDGDALSVITRFDGSFTSIAWLDDLTSALPYHLLTQPRVVVLGAGGGLDVLQALALGASAVDAVELNPQLVELLRGPYREFAGDLYRHPQVRVHIGDARGFMAATDAQYDLIQISLLDSFAGAGAGTQAVSESYLYTVEALRAYYTHLYDGGYLAITRWHKLPPRDALKLVATMVDALKDQDAVADRLVLIHGWQTDTLLLRKGVFTAGDIAGVRAFCRARGFDLAYAPAQAPAAGRFHHSEHDSLAEGSRALLGVEREAWLRDYKFNLRPATDDRPYFFHFFRWRVLPELLRLREQGGVVLLDSGYLVLIATLAQALPFSLLLILAPLAAGRLPPPGANVGRWRPALYFLCLGLAFFFIEIAFIQKFILFVGHPLYAVAIVLCGFLLFAGLGSGVSARLRIRRRAVDVVVSGIVLAALLLLALLPALLAYGAGWPLPLKMLLAFMLPAPLAFAMGMPFPLGLSRLAQARPALLPWAWAINGCASVLSVLLASLCAIHFGFRAAILVAVGLYVLAAIVWRAGPREPAGSGEGIAGWKSQNATG